MSNGHREALVCVCAERLARLVAVSLELSKTKPRLTLLCLCEPQVAERRMGEMSNPKFSSGEF